MTSRQMGEILLGRITEVHIRGRSGTEGCAVGTFMFDQSTKLCSWLTPYGAFHAQMDSIDYVGLKAVPEEEKTDGPETSTR